MNSENSEKTKSKIGFMKLFFSSCLGTIVGLLLLGGAFMFFGIQASKSSSPTIKPNSILKLKLNKALPELSNNIPEDHYSIQNLFSKNIGLSDMCKLIDLAANDDNIKGIFLDLSSVPVGWATAKVLRNTLMKFKESSKFIISYATYYDQKSYYIGSVADHLYLHPEGNFSFTGFAAQLMYFKGLMDKLGVTAQIFYAGKFKSATEPFRRKNMTPENRIQVTKYMSGMYDIYLQDLEVSRNVSAEELFRIADNALIREPIDAVEHKLIDATKYKDEILDEIRNLLGTAKDDKIEVTSAKNYKSVKKEEFHKTSNKNKVAVIYAEGSIVDGRGENGSIGGDKYASIIRKLRKDNKVKAIVMRVNSGGGSALASDIIWRELAKAKEQGIHVVTSMGDVAASGGYYIAANSEEIFAEENTITGSIGVFGMVPNMRKLYENHLGITMDTIKIGKFSMMSNMNTFFAFSEEEGKIIQDGVDKVYMTFKTRVGEGRGMSLESVDSIAQGRVWLGKVAKEIGLVDKIGGLNDAIASVAKLSNLDDNNYQVVCYPKIKTFEEKLMASFGEHPHEEEARAKILKNLTTSLRTFELAEYNDYYDLITKIRSIKEMQGIQMRLPFEVKIN
ncbi:MAG: signal peptide peptidase SppA [Saprospiraceae bacterium]|nr:signal peptide peptidase SppA [Saprospiraceae bacterium]